VKIIFISLFPIFSYSENVGPVTFPFRPVISQKTSYKGTKAKPNKNIPTVAKNSFETLFLILDIFKL